jgi:hypothetical protein
MLIATGFRNPGCEISGSNSWDCADCTISTITPMESRARKLDDRWSNEALMNYVRMDYNKDASTRLARDRFEFINGQ